MTNIVKMTFGSHLYGTNTPQSDMDFKAVYIPSARDILLGRVKDVISTSTKPTGQLKNGAGDVDTETYALHKFLKLVCEGQTVALDMLFCPREFRPSEHIEDPYIWEEIVKNKDKLICKKYMSFVGYCRTQANKYGIKGSRMAAVEAVVAAIQGLSGVKRIEEYKEWLQGVCDKHPEHVKFVTSLDNNIGKDVEFFEVCGKKQPVRNTIFQARDCYYRIWHEYGERARQAKINEGIDWKALSHAVRIGEQAIELLTTGNVVFPRPNAGHLIRIKQGDYTYEYVAARIEQLLADIEIAAEKSKLRAEPDQEWVDDFIEYKYANSVYRDLEMRLW